MTGYPLARLDLIETSDEEPGYFLGNFFFITPPEVVSPRYNLVLLRVRDILGMLVEPFKREHLVGIANDIKFGLAISL